MGFRNVRTEIEQWVIALEAVDADMDYQEDIEFVAQNGSNSWEETIARDGPRGEEKHAAGTWDINREEETPSLQVYLYLFETTQF